jgi:transposase
LPRDKFLPWCAQLPAGCLVAMEASSSAHYWARKLLALGLQARIIPAHLVVPYRLQGKGGKNDANDAAAICEAASRPQMHFVAIKSVEQQSMLCIHRLREGFKQERVACINRIRGLLAEFGLVFPQKPEVLRPSHGPVRHGRRPATIVSCEPRSVRAATRLLRSWQPLAEHHASVRPAQSALDSDGQAQARGCRCRPSNAWAWGRSRPSARRGHRRQ